MNIAIWHAQLVESFDASLVALQPEDSLFALSMIGSVYTKVVSLIADLDWKASILWQTNILDLKTRDYLDAGYDLFRDVAWKVSVSRRTSRHPVCSELSADAGTPET